MIRTVVFGCAMIGLIHCAAPPVLVTHQCEAGFYPSGDVNKTCAPCTRCPVGGIEIRPCVNGQDTECACRGGHFVRKGHCVRCRKCKAGTEVIQECKGNNNSICQACRPGYFSSAQSEISVCKPCLRCRRQEEDVKACTSTSNTVCGDCKRGYYRSTYLNQCWKCSYCYPEYPNITAPVRDCQIQNLKPQYTCIPLERSPFGFVPDWVTEPGEITTNVTGIANSTEAESSSLIIIKIFVYGFPITVMIVAFLILHLTLKKSTENRRAKVLDYNVTASTESHVNRMTLLDENEHSGAKIPREKFNDVYILVQTEPEHVATDFRLGGSMLDSTGTKPLLFKPSYVDDTPSRPSSGHELFSARSKESSVLTVKCPLRTL